MNKYIPLSIPNFEGNEKKYVDDAIEQGWVSTGGAYITRLEKDMAAFLHTENVAACQSGTSAIHLSLVEAGVKPGDVVLVPPLTFIAAVNPVKYQFATPVFIDCDDSFCMDPDKLKEFCEEECTFNGTELKYKNQTVKALVVVHVFGNMADMESIMTTAKKYNIKVIEDATEALGTRYLTAEEAVNDQISTYAGKYAGTIGDYGAFSFNGNKIITTGGGGAVTANNSKTVDHLRYLSTQAKDDPHYYIHHEVGYNYRMTNLQAALGVAQMEELPEFIRRKQRNYELYKELFKDFELAELIPFRSGTESNKWFYSLKLDRSRIKVPMRDIITYLDTKGIQTRAIWGLINEQKPYLNEVTYKLEKAPYYAERILNIPSSTQITEEEIQYVAKTIKEYLKDIT
ncbi:MAG: LegC family aminotransferase [Lachnospiraceae bacterium]|nr:LegC family aminotransferase [Lachnospiraceae bacterium]